MKTCKDYQKAYWIFSYSSKIGLLVIAIFKDYLYVYHRELGIKISTPNGPILLFSGSC